MLNPNPGRITKQIWWLWQNFHKAEPTCKLGGIYDNKPGYHNTRAGNVHGNYSIVHPLDLKGPSDKAAAIDLTFPDAQHGRYDTINKYAQRLLLSGKDQHDERGDCLREFFGQTDGDRQVEGWDFQSVGPSTSDTSHLWHLHLSIVRAYVTSDKAMRSILSILLGEKVAAWRAKEAKL